MKSLEGLSTILAATYPRIKRTKAFRNFGQHYATMQALDQAKGGLGW